jgi:hypothetical protein
MYCAIILLPFLQYLTDKENMISRPITSKAALVVPINETESRIKMVIIVWHIMFYKLLYKNSKYSERNRQNQNTFRKRNMGLQ